MNKYTALGLEVAARSWGRRVIVVSANGRNSRHAMVGFNRHAVGVERVSLADGRISYHSGGQILFMSAQSDRERGRSADTVYIERDALDLYPGISDRYGRCIQGSTRGEVVYE